MGGQAAVRGFQYQGLSAILTVLSESGDGWDAVKAECDTPGDKVDIALFKCGKPVRCIQVKSRVDVIGVGSVRRWAQALRDDAGGAECELILIGQLSDSAVKLAKASDSGLGVRITNLIFNTDMLIANVRDNLHRYCSQRGSVLEFDKLSFIASALQGDMLDLSTGNDPVSRQVFDNRMVSRIKMLEQEYDEQRTLLTVVSFRIGDKTYAAEDENVCNLTEMFDGRYLKAGYDWKGDYWAKIRDFLKKRHYSDTPYRLRLETLLTGSIAAGRMCHKRYRINVFPEQNGRLWDDSMTDKNYPGWKVEYLDADGCGRDIGLVLSINNDILCNVRDYVGQNVPEIGRIIHFKPENGCENTSIHNGAHANRLAGEVYNRLSSELDPGKTVHIFAAAPGGFMFYLGIQSLKFGRCIMYEFDNARKLPHPYYPSVTFEGEE